MYPRIVSLVAVALVAASCSSNKTTQIAPPPSNTYTTLPPSGANNTLTRPGANTTPTGFTQQSQAELRIRPVSATGFTHLFVAPADISVTGGGQTLPVDVKGDVIDLANENQAWLVGTIGIPRGVDQLEVTLKLDDYGAFESAGGNGEIRARRAPLTFSVPVALMVNKKAVVELNVARSLVSTSAERFEVVPQYRILY